MNKHPPLSSTSSSKPEGAVRVQILTYVASRVLIQLHWRPGKISGRRWGQESDVSEDAQTDTDAA